MHTLQLLHRIANGWETRARVKNPIDMTLAFDADKKDFLEDNLPFVQHPWYHQLNEAEQRRILTCAWVLYNAKTICIETEIIHPVCLQIIAGQWPGATDELAIQLITETLVDESYHIHLCHYANTWTMKNRQLQCVIPTLSLITEMNALKANYTHPWQKQLIHLAAAIVSEIFITDYLDLIKSDHKDKIQPFHALIVHTHRSDELAHEKIFTHLAHEIFQQLNAEQKEFFGCILPQPLLWLADAEINAWRNILTQLSISHPEFMLNEAVEDNQYQPLHTNPGAKSLVELAAYLGILERQAGREAFQRTGILV